MQQAINFRNFEIFDQNNTARPRAGRRRSRFTKFIINGYRVYMHVKDRERAHRGYLGGINNARNNIAVEIARPRDPDIPEYRLYGFAWATVEFPNGNGPRKFLVSHRDTLADIAELFIP